MPNWNGGTSKVKTTVGFFVGILLAGQFCYASGSVLKIMPLGDSITEGGHEHRSGFSTTEGSYRTVLVPKLLDLNLEILFVGSKIAGPATLAQRHHEGHSGWRIDELIAGRVYARSYEKGIESWLPSYSPNLILLMIGTNDIVQNYFLDQAPLRFAKLLDEIWRLTPCATIFVASVIPTNNSHLNDEVEKYNSALHNYVRTLKISGHPVVWVDMYNEAKMSWKTGDYSDGVHPSFQGYAKMANLWFSYIASFIKENSAGQTNGCVPYPSVNILHPFDINNIGKIEDS